MNIADSIPIMEMVAKECNAGCLAKINTPTPKIVVKTDKMIDVLCVVIDDIPDLILLVIKIL